MKSYVLWFSGLLLAIIVLLVILVKGKNPGPSAVPIPAPNPPSDQTKVSLGHPRLTELLGRGTEHEKAYDPSHPGPGDGSAMDVPVLSGTLKETSEKYNAKFRKTVPGPNRGGVGFVGSIATAATPDASFPFQPVDTQWELAGLLTPVNKEYDAILNLYRRPIAPLQDLWEYSAQDKNGFVIPLKEIRYLDDGDHIPHILGKERIGPWKVHLTVKNQWIWM